MNIDGISQLSKGTGVGDDCVNIYSITFNAKKKEIKKFIHLGYFMIDSNKIK